MKDSINRPTLDSLLVSIYVLAPGDWSNNAENAIGDWWAVATDDGIIAYFGSESDALWFRLAYINNILNIKNFGK